MSRVSIVGNFAVGYVEYGEHRDRVAGPRSNHLVDVLLVQDNKVDRLRRLLLNQLYVFDRNDPKLSQVVADKRLDNLLHSELFGARHGVEILFVNLRLLGFLCVAVLTVLLLDDLGNSLPLEALASGTVLELHPAEHCVVCNKPEPGEPVR